MISHHAALHDLAETLMPRTVQAIANDIDARLRVHRLTLVQRRALVLLCDGRAATPGDLSRVMESDAGSTTRLIDRMVSKALCRRVPNSNDRRSVRLEITEVGQAALQETHDTVAAVLLDWFSVVEGSELDTVSRVLSRMLAERR